MFMKFLVRINKCFILVIIQLSQISCWQDERWNSWCCYWRIWQNEKGANKNFVETTSQNEERYAFLNGKCLRHSMKRIQGKNHVIGTYEISKNFLSCFDDEIYILHYGYDRLGLGY